MSVQFGIWNQAGQPFDEHHFERAKALLAPYGPDDSACYREGNVAIHYRAFHTTEESRREVQPHTTRSRSLITWDGRLDNRQELIEQYKDSLGPGATDVEIVAAAYEKQGTVSFGRFIGDWALSVWNPGERSLILAKDPIGARHLYYAVEKDQVCWSTILDPLVLLAARTFALEEEYVAGWLSFFPATHLTPYAGVRAVPPSSFVVIGPGKLTVSKYWDFNPDNGIRYRTDGEYEEHFRGVFRESVRRRLRSDSPVLAELSGGMDSSSIVCMADTITASGSAEIPRLDTLSYYNDSEPNWNERFYFTKIEEKRGRTGCHIDVSNQEAFRFQLDTEHFAATPGSTHRLNDAAKQFAAFAEFRGNRVALSGIGGDEVLGGLPTPVPELEDLLARIKFRQLAHVLKLWALNKRKPWFFLLYDAARSFFPTSLGKVRRQNRPAPWLRSGFIERNRLALEGYATRLKLFGPLPSFQENIATFDMLRRQLSCNALSCDPPREKRYPYLDRDLLEFLFAIPREQLVRPNQRRSLMRRALTGIVPDEVLNRKRKAYIARAPLATILADWPHFTAISENMISSVLGVVDPQRYLNVLQTIREGGKAPLLPLLRTVATEIWLRNLARHGVLDQGQARAFRQLSATYDLS